MGDGLSKKVLLLATGPSRFYDEARGAVIALRKIGFEDSIELWVDNLMHDEGLDASIRLLEPLEFSCDPYTGACVHKARLLARQENVSFCFLDSYARVLDLENFLRLFSLGHRYGLAIPLDIRRTLKREMELARGVGNDLLKAVENLPPSFPIWNVGVVFGSGRGAGAKLLRTYLSYCEYAARNWPRMRDQVLFSKAVWDEGTCPLTLADNANVRRPFVRDPIILHTRVYGRYYGIHDVDNARSILESFKLDVRIKIFRWARIRSIILE